MATRYGILRSAARSLWRPLSTESHSDFARVLKTPPGGSVQDRIAAHLKESKVVLYMKGLPSAPQCGFSWKTVQILNAMGVEYRAHNVLLDEELRQGIKQYSAWPTIPQVYVDGEFVGGLDIVEGMARSGELKQLLNEKGALDADAQKAATEQAKDT